MVISRDIASLSQTINGQGREMKIAGSSTSDTGINFHNILKKILPEIQNTSLSLTSVSALNKEQLMLFLRPCKSR